MSYDIWLEIDTGGPEPTQVFDWNFTSNAGKVWRAAGADLAEFDGKTAGECAPIVRDALAVLGSDPGRWRALDPPNGWGKYDHLVPALHRLAEGLEAHPATTVRVSR